MNKQLKEEWLKDLSTSKKAKNVLRNSEGEMCCLGVLACTIQRLYPEVKFTWVDDRGKLITGEEIDAKAIKMEHKDDKFGGLIPIEILDAIGESDLGYGIQQDLAVLNDSTDTFEEEVIPFIENNL